MDFTNTDKQAILIIFDSVRQDHLSCYGYPRKTSPNIDEFAERGTIFKATTLPGDANEWYATREAIYAILSGQSKYINHEDKRPLGKHQLLQDIIKPSMFASNHALLFSLTNWDKGWDYSYLMETSMYRPAQDVVNWTLQTWKKERPLFTLLWFIETHAIYRPDESWKAFYDDEIPTKKGEVVLFDKDFEKQYGHDFRKAMAFYDGAIHRLDAVIKPILNLASNDVLVMVGSDHGDYIGEYGHWFTHASHNITAEQSFSVLKHVFLVSSYPTGTYMEPATHLDIAPTILDWLGMPKASWHEGHSLLGHNLKYVKEVNDKNMADMHGPTKYFGLNLTQARYQDYYHGNLLDIGCGNGQFGITLAKEKRVNNVIMIDISDVAISYARQSMQNLGIEVPIFRTSIEEFQTDMRFDVITAWEVIEHFANLDNALEKIRSLLNINGIFMGTTPEGNCCDNEAHLQHFPSASSLEKRLQKYFEKVEVERIDITGKGEWHLAFRATR